MSLETELMEIMEMLGKKTDTIMPLLHEKYGNERFWPAMQLFGIFVDEWNSEENRGRDFEEMKIVVASKMLQYPQTQEMLSNLMAIQAQQAARRMGGVE